MVEATLASSQSSRADDKLEKLTDISTQLAKTMEMNMENASRRTPVAPAGPQRSILNLQPRWNFPEVYGKPTDDYEKFFKEFEETIQIMKNNHPGGIPDREIWMILGKQVRGSVRVAYDNIVKRHERAAEQGKPIWTEAELYGELYREFKAYQLQFVKNQDEKLAGVMEEYRRIRRMKDEDFTSWRLRWER